MKTILSSIFLFIAHLTFAQTAKLTIHVAKPETDTIEYWRHNRDDLFQEDDYPFALLVDGKLTIQFNDLIEMERIDVGDWDQIIYVSPGDDLLMTVHTNGKITITGQGSNNNQPFDLIDYFESDNFKKDTLPDNLLKHLNAIFNNNALILKEYITKNKPSSIFIKHVQNELGYQKLEMFKSFYGNHNFTLRKLPNYPHLNKSWKKCMDSLASSIDINDPLALSSANFRRYLGDFVSRKKEELWSISVKDRFAFLKEWYPELDSANASSANIADSQNDLSERIINKYLTGEVNAYAYLQLFADMKEGKKDNAVIIFDRFKKAHPNTRYPKEIDDMIADIKVREKRKLSDQMVLIDKDKIKTFKDLLEYTKGKTVLVDMWGTWCVPCRREIEKNSTQLKAHFKGKPLNFLYVANYDLLKEDLWKKLIAFYNLEGQHLLASQDLTKEIMDTVKGTGFPTYLIIKRDGTYELSKAGYPMNRAALIEQLESHLAKN